MMATLPPLPKLSGPGATVSCETPYGPTTGRDTPSPTDTSSLLPRATLTPIRDQTLSDPPSTPGTDSSSILDVSVLDPTISTDTSKTVKEVIVDDD